MLRVVLQAVIGVGMDEHAKQQIAGQPPPTHARGPRRAERIEYARQGAPMDDEPAEERAGLVWVECVHLEHRHRVRPDRFIPEPVNAQLQGRGVSMPHSRLRAPP